MWIAKPIERLSPAEREIYKHLETHAPLSQTLGWALASQAIGAQVYAVFHTANLIGGLISQFQADGRFECINGPILHWDDPNWVAKEFATFVYAFSKACPHFRVLSLKPRWEEQELESRLSSLPISPFQILKAETLHVSVASEDHLQIQSFSKRLQRTLKLSQRVTHAISWETPNETSLTTFASSLSRFASRKNFLIPPLPWFLKLNQADYPLRLCTVEMDGARTQLLLVEAASTVHYLMGYDERHGPLRSAISSASLAHLEVLKRSKKSAHLYDLNGYVHEPGADDPYEGVAQFKKQFQGKRIIYKVPEFVIEA